MKKSDTNEEKLNDLLIIMVIVTIILFILLTVGWSFAVLIGGSIFSIFYYSKKRKTDKPNH